MVKEAVTLLKFLLAGLVFFSIVVPAENLLFQSNKPEIQSLYMLTLVSLNIILNYVFIQNFGLVGAAMATSLVYCSTVFVFNFYVVIFTKLKKGIFFVPNGY